MKKRGTQFLRPFGRRKAFTLIELLLSLGIAAILIALLTNILSTSLGSASHLSRKMTRQNDEEFALEAMVDEIQAADAFYRIEPKWIQLYIREDGKEGHKVVSYLLENNEFSRYADHYNMRYDPRRLSKKPGVRTKMLKNVESLQFQRKGEVVEIELKCGGRDYRRIVAIRGRYE